MGVSLIVDSVLSIAVGSDIPAEMTLRANVGRYGCRVDGVSAQVPVTLPFGDGVQAR